MEKIICDVCGTSYPDSAKQCPICGYVHASHVNSSESASEKYQPVRGGRFSNNNVKRRSPGSARSSGNDSSDRRRKVKGSNFAMGVLAIVLLVAVILVIIFVASKLTDAANSPTEIPEQTITNQPTDGDDVFRLCQELHTSKPIIELSAEGDVASIHVSPVPADTTDPISYYSMNPDVATVSSDGTVKAVSGGETAVNVRCGEKMLIITVKCTFAPPVPEGGTWSMNRKDITLSKKGETWDLYSKSSTIPKNLIIWTSDDETVAKIDGGVVEAVGSGKTKVHGECNGVKYSCTIRCNLPKDEDTAEDTKPDTTEPNEPSSPTTDSKTAKISHEDVTLRPNGEANEKSFQLTLRDGNGNKLDVVWTASEEGYVTIEGNLITAVKAGKSITVSTTYEGVTYKCTIRLK